MSEPSQEDILQQQELLRIYRRSLAEELKTEARYGLLTPRHITLSINETRENIQRVKDTLHAWGIETADYPDDYKPLHWRNQYRTIGTRAIWVTPPIVLGLLVAIFIWLWFPIRAVNLSATVSIGVVDLRMLSVFIGTVASIFILTYFRILDRKERILRSGRLIVLEGLIRQLQILTDNLWVNGEGDSNYRFNENEPTEGGNTVVYQMIKELQELHKIESGRVHIDRVNVVVIVQQTLEYVQKATEYSNRALKFSSDIPDGELFICCDEKLLRESLSYILDNALKYSENGDRITVRVYKRWLHAIIEIEDTGTGIDKEDINHVWKEFYRGLNAGNSLGYGLGLPKAQAIVARHHGHIELYSTRREGTKITLRLPTNY